MAILHPLSVQPARMVLCRSGLTSVNRSMELHMRESSGDYLTHIGITNTSIK